MKPAKHIARWEQRLRSRGLSPERGKRSWLRYGYDSTKEPVLFENQKVVVRRRRGPSQQKRNEPQQSTRAELRDLDEKVKSFWRLVIESPVRQRTRHGGNEAAVEIPESIETGPERRRAVHHALYHNSPRQSFRCQYCQSGEKTD